MGACLGPSSLDVNSLVSTCAHCVYYWVWFYIPKQRIACGERKVIKRRVLPQFLNVLYSSVILLRWFELLLVTPDVLRDLELVATTPHHSPEFIWFRRRRGSISHYIHLQYCINEDRAVSFISRLARPTPPRQRYSINYSTGVEQCIWSHSTSVGWQKYLCLGGVS